MPKRNLLLFFFLMIALSVMGCKVKTSAPRSLNPNISIVDAVGSDAVKGKPGISYDGDNFFCVWKKGNDIYGARITTGGTSLDPGGISISVGRNESTYPPSVCYDGANHFVVWTANRSGVAEIYAARVTKQGQVLDPEGIQITEGAAPKIRMPGIAFDGANFLVVWRTNADWIYGALVSKTGVNLSNKQGFPITNHGSAYYPSVAYNGSHYLVVWHQGYPWDNSMDIWGARVDREGVVLDPAGFPICNEAQNQDQAMVASDGKDFLVVWYDWRPDNRETRGSSYGTRVLADGTVLDKPAFPIADHVGGQHGLPVIFDGTDYLVLWMTDSSYKERLADVYGRRISINGKVLEKQAIPFSNSFWHQYGPVLGYGENYYCAAWSDRRFYGSEASVFGQVFHKDELPQNPPGHDSIPENTDWTRLSCSLFGNSVHTGMAFGGTDLMLFGDQSFVRYNGSQWSVVSAESNRGYGVWADGPDNLWVGGWASAFYHFDGQNFEHRGCWSQAFSANTGNVVTGIWGTDHNNLWATTDKGYLLKYDGNHNWNEISANVPFDLQDIWGTGSNNIYAVGERGTIVHYNGSKWSDLSGISTKQTLHAIWGNGSKDIFAVGDWGTILHFNGSSWSMQSTCTTKHLYDVWGFGGSDAYAVGQDGVIIHYDGNQWEAWDSGTDQNLYTVFGWRQTQSSSRYLWIAGEGQSILHRQY